MTETEIILEAVCKPARTKKRKTSYEPEELSQLMQVRDVYRCVQKGEHALVVTDTKKTFEEVFDTRTPVMKLFKQRGLITLKTVSEVTADDLELNIFEMKV